MFSILINTRCYYAGWSISCWKRTFQLHNFSWLNIRTNSQFNSKLPNKWNYNFSTLCLRFKVRLHNSTRFLWNPSTEDWPDEKYKIMLLVDFNAKVGQTFRLLKNRLLDSTALEKQITESWESYSFVYQIILSLQTSSSNTIPSPVDQ